MNKWFILLSFLSFFSLKVLAQDWVALEEGLETPCSEFFNDADTSLIALGSFPQTNGGLYVDGFVRWDGQAFSTLTGNPAGESWSNGASNMVRYQEDLFFLSGPFDSVIEGFTVNEGVCMYDGNEITNPINQYVDDAINTLAVYRDQLVIGTANTSLGQATMYLWNGNELDSISANGFFADDFNEAFFAVDIIEFDSKIVYAGNFGYIQGGLYEILSWCPEEGFEDMNHGIRGFVAHVGCLEVYNDELIIGGYILKANGNPTDFIMRWDGENYKPMGTIGANDRVDVLMSYGGYLYAGGQFDAMEGTNCHIARWNGETWEAFSSSNFAWNGIDYAGAIRDFEVFQGELYICGSIHEIDGVEVDGIAKYTGPLALSNFSDEINDLAEPNITVSAGEVILENLPDAVSYLLEIANAEKTLVLSEWSLKVADAWVINTSGLAPGEYHLSLTTAQGHYTTKIQL